MAVPSNDLPSTEQLTKLRENIVDTFNLEELRRLAFDLGGDYEELRGEGKSAKIQALLEYLIQRQQIPALLSHLKDLRPKEDWESYHPAEPEAKSPYKGLHFFTEADAHLFFGRERLTAQLIEHLSRNRLLVVVGASGSGKSSLVRAGLVPAVRRGEIEVNGRSSQEWPIHIITPGDRPLKTLAVTLTRDIESVTAASTLAADLRQDANSLDLFLMRQMADQPFERLLLVIDQFEELFTLCDDKEERELFVNNLMNAVQSTKQGQVILVLTLRADFYTHAVQYEALRPLLQTCQAIVGEMNSDEFRQSIEQPATKNGWEFQAGLVTTILQDVGSEPGALPLLSHALQETWRRREGKTMTLAGYQAAGGVRRAIAMTADAVYAGLEAEQQRLARTIFLRLTELGEGTEDTRRRVWQTELVRRPEEQGAVTSLLQRLTQARLVTTDTYREQNGRPLEVVEVAHEALIREWPTLRAWLDQSRERLRFQRQLTRDCHEWLEAGRDLHLLYRGAKLAQAHEYVSSYGDEISQDELDFVTEGIVEEQRQRFEREAQQQRELMSAQALASARQQESEARQRELEAQQRRTRVVRWASIGLAGLLLLAVAASVVAIIAGQQANERARLAESQALAAASQTVQEISPMRSLLLAIEAGKTAETALAMDALNLQLPQMTKSLLTLSHVDRVTGSKWNRDESRLLTWSGDGSAKVWDSITGEVLLTLSHPGWVNGATWNGDESRLLTWSNGGSARVWDSTTGEVLLTLSHEGGVNGAQWSGDESRLPTPIYENWVRGAMWNRDESRLLTWGSDDRVKVWDSTTGEVLLTLTHEGGVNGAQWNSDESRLLTWSGDGSAKVWDSTMGEVLLTLTHEGGVNGAQWNGDESRLLTWGSDDRVKVWDSTTGEVLLTLSHEGRVGILVALGAQWNSDESRLLTWNDDGSAKVWDSTTGEVLLTLSHEAWVNGAQWNGDESRLLTWSHDGTAQVWDSTTGEVLLTLSHEAWVNGAQWNSDESRLLTWSGDGSAKVWDSTTGEMLLTLSHEGEVNGAQWNRDESRLLTWSNAPGTLTWRTEGSAGVWDSTMSEVLLTFSHEGGVNGAQWNGDESRLLTWSHDGTAQVWDSTTGEVLLTLSHEGGVNGAQWNGDESRLLTWSHDGTAQIWDSTTGEVLLTLSHEGEVNGAQWNRDESRLLTWSHDGTAQVWDSTTGDVLLTLSHEGGVNGAQWNGDESRLLTWSHVDSAPGTLTWSNGGSARVWDSATGEVLLTLSGVQGAQWNSDESRVLTWSDDGSAKVWDSTTGDVLLTLSHDSWVHGAQWNSDESRLLTWSRDGRAKVWDSTTGEELLSLSHEDFVNGAQWNGDESQLLTWSHDGTARVWDATTGALLFSLRGDRFLLTAARWNKEGSRILVTSGGFVRVYYTHTTELAELACQYAVRNLTWVEWQLYFPGQNYRKTCEHLPIHPSVPEEQSSNQ